jgi:hypothetical protein
MTIPRPYPVLDDPDSSGFWAAAARGELVVRACSDCGRVLHLPKAHCDGCRGWNTGWREVPGHARLYSYTVVEHQVHPSFPVPHTIVLVELDGVDGAAGRVRLLGTLAGRPELWIGMAMRVRFEPVGDGVVLPQWEPCEPVPCAPSDRSVREES